MPPAGKLQHQKQGSGGQQDAAGKGLEGELLVEEDKGQDQGNHSQDAPVARPDRIRNSQLLGLIRASAVCSPVRNTMPQAMASTTAVRMPVARLEGTPWIPAFARIEVRAANRADSRANTNHVPNAVTSG